MRRRIKLTRLSYPLQNDWNRLFHDVQFMGTLKNEEAVRKTCGGQSAGKVLIHRAVKGVMGRDQQQRFVSQLFD